MSINLGVDDVMVDLEGFHKLYEKVKLLKAELDKRDLTILELEHELLKAKSDNIKSNVADNHECGFKL